MQARSSRSIKFHRFCVPTARCLSQTASQPESCPDGNEVVNPTFVNRNPRNLEQMALAVKERGWKTTWPHREFYHRCVRWTWNLPNVARLTLHASERPGRAVSG